MIEQVLKVTLLYDFYGGLLTERQRKCIEQHYFDDLSLSEVADNFGVSRQAVHDIIKRAVEAMNDFEDKLGLAGRRRQEKENLFEVNLLLEQAIKETGYAPPALARAREKIRQMLAEGDD
ncbi:MAG: YlxM family DNA-binding protein [Acidaminococcales bacterium]|jgi:predicted DNA-binding protein YlxM (UPF0122 family)|nr:YlxM family DNA-binding protein [Acidaminococcales bacterium]